MERRRVAEERPRGAGIRGRSFPPLFAVLLLLALTAAVYSPVTGFDFVNFDDDRYVTRNEAVRGGLSARGVSWALTDLGSGNWHPLTWLSHLTDVELFGLDAGGHHAVSLLLHLANTALLFAALRALTGAPWPSAAAAALFALHPLHVESVAWVSERKDVLSALFWMLGLLAYARYARRPSPARYAWVAAALALGLAAKAMLVTLPLVLLLLDWWPLGRLRAAGSGPGAPSPAAAARALFLEKIPLLLLSGLAGAITLAAQRGVPLLVPLEVRETAARVSNALWGYLWYLGKTLWPSSLAVYYPFPAGGPPLGKTVLAALVLAAVTLLVLRGRRSRPALAVGWLWFLVVLAPVIGLIQAGNQAVADRYTYLPLIGLFLAAAWGVGDPRRRWPAPRAVTAALSAVTLAAVAALALASSLQVRHWRNSRTLFERAVEVTPAHPVTLNNLANALTAEGRDEEAIALYRRALLIRPDAIVHANLGAALLRVGRLGEARESLREALARDPRLEEVRRTLAALPRE
ncbi:MAG TPA: tetratricopeptide repeat protein [Candidatus Methanoperedens sp.]|nr:tetratricopeptide repeat protein [Candidatus Methanoperedens sp.]